MPKDASILDKYFGTKIDTINYKKYTSDWRCEPDIVPLLEAYLEEVNNEVGEIHLTEKLRRDWYAAARELREQLGAYNVPESEWRPFVKWAFGQMKRKGLDNKNHRSLCFLVTRWQSRKREEDTSKYLEWLK